MNQPGNENDHANTMRSLWCRLIDGAELSNDEAAAIRDHLQTNDTLRSEIGTDATMHALLRSTHDVRQSEDQFVRGVLGRCFMECSESTTSAATEQSALSELSGVAAVPPRSAAVAASSVSDRRQHQRRSQARQWKSMTVTCVLFISMGILSWWIASHPESNTGDPVVSGKGAAATAGVNPPASQSPSSGRQTALVQQAGSVGAKVVPQSVGPDTASETSDNTSSTKKIAVNGAQPVNDLRDSMIRGNPAEVPAQEATIPGSTFVTLSYIEDAVWERTWSEGDRLGDEVVRLFGGRIELTFDDGAKVTLDGPVEFRPMTSGRMQLRRGRLMAAVPQEAIGFTVSTPTSQVVDLGTEFEVAVKETGASDVVVKKGEIEVMPAVSEGDTPRTWRLVPTGLNQACFFERSGDSDSSPVSAAVRGADGAFQGVISINGQTAEFTSAEAFDDVRERVMQQFAASQRETLQQWTEFVQSMQKKVEGTMQLNGAEVQFGNFEDVMKLQQQLLERMQAPGGTRQNLPETDFSGSININGRVIKFRTREEYEAARRSAFGAAANFGAGDFLGRRKSPVGNNAQGKRP